MKKFQVQLVIFVLMTVPFLSRAGGDEVVVIYNTRAPESKAVADYYARMRNVPAKQIYGFALTTNEVMSREEFRNSLQKPLAEKLEVGGLWKFGDVTIGGTNGEPERVVRRVVASKIRYAVLCYGVPLKIAPSSEIDEIAEKLTRAELRRNEAAVDSDLAWLPLIKTDPPLTGPMMNWTYCTTNTATLGPTNGILLVARLDGPAPETARGLVDKALEAERDGLWGRAYFDARGLKMNDTYYLGDEWILDAAKISRSEGFETTVDDNPQTFPADFPMSQIAIYCGWYDGDVSGPFALPKVEFMPGAFAYHLHSYSADTLRSATRNWCGPLLAKGATCTMGCVYEPYLSGTPNIAAFVERFFSGFTFGEAAWAAQPVLSWQTTVVGDPLYCPFGKPPAQLHAELARRHSKLIEWSFLRLADLALARREPIFQLAVFLENIPATTNSAVLTEKLADLYEMEGKPSSAIDTYEHALKLNPSPEQRIQIRLTLGEKLLAAKRDADALENYKMLLKESLDYPGKNLILEKIAALEQKLAGTNTLTKP